MTGGLKVLSVPDTLGVWGLPKSILSKSAVTAFAHAGTLAIPAMPWNGLKT